MPIKQNELEWMISIVKGAMEYGTLNYGDDDWEIMERLYKEIYDEDLK